MGQAECPQHPSLALKQPSLAFKHPSLQRGGAEGRGKMAELGLHCARDAVGEEAAGGRIQYSTFVPRGPESVELSHISLLHSLKFKKNIENQYKNHTQRRRMDGG